MKKSKLGYIGVGLVSMMMSCGELAPTDTELESSSSITGTSSATESSSSVGISSGAVPSSSSNSTQSSSSNGGVSSGTEQSSDSGMSSGSTAKSSSSTAQSSASVSDPSMAGFIEGCTETGVKRVTDCFAYSKIGDVEYKDWKCVNEKGAENCEAFDIGEVWTNTGEYPVKGSRVRFESLNNGTVHSQMVEDKSSCPQDGKLLAVMLSGGGYYAVPNPIPVACEAIPMELGE